MCGIVGFLGPASRDPGATGTVSAMLGAIAHRGPDDAGAFLDATCAMGTARLAIIDPALGAQPVCDPGERYWLCYNGEIYNYRELRAELEALGRPFRTHSDTEVLLQAWLQWGEACLPRLNGGFAFALYDRRTATLVLARDRYGKRPLFYAWHRGTFYFASEMKAFLAVPGFGFAFDPDQLAAILGQWTPLPHQTGFSGIDSLPLGTCLTLTETSATLRRFSGIAFDDGPAIGSRGEAIERIRQQMRESVALRLCSDVEVGVYMSGGLDSAIIARLARDALPRLSTFSIAFEDAEFDESAEQQELAAALDTRHSTLRIRHADMVAAFPDAVFHAEVPAFRSAFVPMFLLSQRTRASGVKVVLSGEGADEAFLGYDLFKETRLRADWDSLDEATRTERLAQLYPHLSHYGPQDVAATTGLYQQFSREHLPGLFSHELRFQNGRFSARLLKQAGDPFAAVGRLAAEEPGFAAMTPVEKAQWLEYQTLLPGYLLSTQGDRMALAHGVENRCPFLDPAVVALASAVNLRFDDGFEEKALLRAAFADCLPSSVVRKRKFPYRAPESAAFASLRPDYLELVLSEAELAKLPFIDQRFARALAQKVLSRDPAEISTKENQTFIFLLSIALLNRDFVAGGRRPGAAPQVRIADFRPVPVPA
ncbi:asparagine synthase (glutamine-hydrolyzing) [Azorhizobium doebereinerae]|uniref:asparagine synthase (glutamine-hydrolyzing) n=1 Tax=Azorhizobium doebereinerae TaxID=281091 RepID=UPI0004150F52|nr:asparagine synthase (glutamine-hydrolyzing) [Azorhizobium doebereinerae]